MKNGLYCYSAIILAAGTSGRMGQHKALLKFDDNNTFIDNIINSMIEANCKIYVVVNPSIKEYFKNYRVPINVIVNDKPELGRARSLKLALKEINGTADIFIHNCDNPYCNLNLLRKMYNVLEEDSYVVPVFKNKGGHPILISKTLHKYLLNIDDNANLKKVLLDFKKIKIETNDDKILFNINTLEEYNLFLEINKS